MSHKVKMAGVCYLLATILLVIAPLSIRQPSRACSAEELARENTAIAQFVQAGGSRLGANPPRMYCATPSVKWADVRNASWPLVRQQLPAIGWLLILCGVVIFALGQLIQAVIALCTFAVQTVRPQVTKHV